MLQDWAFGTKIFKGAEIWLPFFCFFWNRHEFVSRNPWLVNTRKASSICYRGFGCCSHAYPHLFVQKNLSISLITKPTTSISTNLCHIHTGSHRFLFLNPLQLWPNDEEFEGHLNFVNQVARYREDGSGLRFKTLSPEMVKMIPGEGCHHHHHHHHHHNHHNHYNHHQYHKNDYRY